MHTQPGRAAAACGMADGHAHSLPTPSSRVWGSGGGRGLWETHRNFSLVLLRTFFQAWLDSVTELKASSEALPDCAAQHSHRKVG